VLAHGFARLQCTECALERLVPFSCKGRQVLFEPLTLLEKLAALIPRPRINLVVYHGVLAPHCGWRARVVAYGAPPAVPSPGSETTDASRSAPRHWAWAALMRRAFDVDVLACPRCGGRLQLIATVEDPEAIGAILAAASREEPGRAPPSGLCRLPTARRRSGPEGPRTRRSPRSVRSRVGAGPSSGPAPRPGRNSGDTLVVRAVPGGRGSAENGRSVNRPFIPSMLRRWDISRARVRRIRPPLARARVSPRATEAIEDQLEGRVSLGHLGDLR
jgi:hypothetical protein